MAELLHDALGGLAAAVAADAAVVWTRTAGSAGGFVLAAVPHESLVTGSPWSGHPVPRDGPVLESDPARLRALVPDALAIDLPTPPRAALVAAVMGRDIGLVLVWCGDPPPAAAEVTTRLVAESLGGLAARANREQRLQAEAARVSAAMAFLDEAVATIDDLRMVAYVNPAAARLLHLPAGEVPTTRLTEAFAALRSRVLNAAEVDAMMAALETDSRGCRADLVWRFAEAPAALRVHTAPVQTTRLTGRVWVFADVSAELTALAAAEQARDALRASEDLLRANADAMLDPQVLLRPVHDAAGRIVDFVYLDANRAACEQLGLERRELVGERLVARSPGVRESGLFDLYTWAAEADEPLVVDEFRYANPVLGTRARYDLRARRVGDAVSLTWRDVTDRVETAARIAESEERFRLLAENSSDVIVSTNEDVVTWVSPSIELALGWVPQEWVGHRVAEFTSPADHGQLASHSLAAQSGLSLTGRIRVHARDGILHWVEYATAPIVAAGGPGGGVVGALRVVDEQVAAEAELDRRARYDELTGLLNREEAFLRIGALVSHPPRTGQECAVLFCDVDHFKAVNDTFGHAAGDEVLRELARRLRAIVRDHDDVARIGGDELLVVLYGLHGLDDAVLVGEKIRLGAAAPIAVPGGWATTSMSIGVTLIGPGEDVDAFIARADDAMYRAKQSGRNQVVAFRGR